MEELVSILPIIGIALLFWLLIIRPQSRRQKAVVAMQQALEPGTEVMMSSGIYGTLVAIEESHVMLRVTDSVTLKVAKGAIASVVEPDQPEQGPPTHQPERTEDS